MGLKGCLPPLYSLIALIQIHLRFVVLLYMALITNLSVNCQMYKKLNFSRGMSETKNTLGEAFHQFFQRLFIYTTFMNYMLIIERLENIYSQLRKLCQSL